MKVWLLSTLLPGFFFTANACSPTDNPVKTEEPIPVPDPIPNPQPTEVFYDNPLVILLFITFVCSCKSKEYLLLSFTYFDYMCSKYVPLNKELYTRYFNLGTKKIMNKIVSELIHSFKCRGIVKR